jgi:Zn-finger nucleic acid-binding protein
MAGALMCASCGGPLPAASADVPTPCPFCGVVSAPPPRVVEKVVDRVVERVVVRDGAGNPAALPCLRCGQPLVDVVSGQSRVSQCRACGGVWVPVEAVDQLRRASDDDLRRAVAAGEIFALARPPRGPLACPVCAAPLECVPLQDTVHDVDVCRMHGTWFDRTELLAFIEREKSRREGAGAADDLDPEGAAAQGAFGKIWSLFSPRRG